MIKIIYTSILFLLFSVILNSQTITIDGEITDENKTPLSFANVIADSQDNRGIEYAISNDNGAYKLNLEKGITYRITVSYLGYTPYVIELKAVENKTNNFILKESSQELGEVSLTYTPPVTIKKDTITYRVDVFKTGEERKLRDILKKLPAVEVDRAGNVTVQGKKVTKVLVENKEFFTGDSKLAVNNIPADAVDEIEVLDNYSEIGFLKGLEDSNEMAMNIKLKENKKRFVFGDVEAGGGIDKRYLLHPSLYYYSPKTSVNAISDFNNTGVKSFSVKDYLDFEGGASKIIRDTKSYFSLINDDFAKFLGNNDFKESRNQFGALSLTRDISQKTNISTYGIWSDIKNETKRQTLNNYLASDNLLENRTNTGQQNSAFGIGKLKLRFKPNNYTDFTTASYFKKSNSTIDNNTLTNTLQNSNEIAINANVENISFKQDIQWHKRFNKKNTSSAVFNYHFQKSTPKTNWQTGQAFFQDVLPVIEQEEYNILKEKELYSHTIDFAFKHYFTLNRFNHLYLTFGTQLTFDDLDTFEYQNLIDGSINDFSSAGFGNNTGLNFKDISLGLQYKFQIGKMIVKPALVYHNYNWNISQFNNRIAKNKNLLLPEITTKIEFSNTKKLNINYNLRARFTGINNLANRFTLLNFNSVFQGNETLENELYHHARINYYRFSLFKDLFYNVSASYRVKENNFKNSTITQGINLVSTTLLSNFEDKVWNTKGSLRKGIGKFKLSVNGSINKAKYDKPTNNALIANTSINYSYGFGVETRFKEYPNLKLSYRETITDYKANTTSQFETDNFSAYLEYDFLKAFILKIDYYYEVYKNKSLKNSNMFDVGNLSLFYQKENSPWGFEVSINNVFDVDFKQRNSFSSVLVSDERTFILPRITMFKLSYKL